MRASRFLPLALLVAVAVLATGYGAAALAGAALPLAARLALGLPLALLFPGWTLLRALGVREQSVLLGLVLALGASLAEVIALGLLLALGFDQTLGSPLWAVTLAALVLFQATAAAARLDVEGPVPALQAAAWAVVLTLLPALGLGFGATLLAVHSARDVPLPRYTELWASVTPAGSLVADVRNMEGEPVRYQIELRSGGRVLAAVLDRTVAPDTTWRATVPLPAGTAPPATRRITVELYRAGDQEPYREVTVEVRP